MKSGGGHRAALPAAAAPAEAVGRGGFANAAYLALARLAGRLLAARAGVRTVFVRRSLAAGEIDFGRSDIDFGLLLEPPAPGEVDRLVALLRTYRRLRCFRPVIGECLVYTQDEYRTYYLLDPYRASIDRRAAIRLYGPDVPRIRVPVPPAAAIRRQVHWFDRYLMNALHRRNRRNMRKFLLESWNAHAVAAERLREPYVTRRETEAAWRASEGGRLFEGRMDPLRAFAVICELAGRTHRRFRKPLDRLREPRIFRARPPLGVRERTFVLIPTPDTPLPRQARRADAFVGTPEVLDLFVRYAEPFLYPAVEPVLGDLGAEPPPWRAYAWACLRRAAGPKLREPGFAGSPVEGVLAGMELVRRSLPSLRRKEPPPAGPPPGIAGSPGLEEYYRDHYPRLLAEAREASEELLELLGVSVPGQR